MSFGACRSRSTFCMGEGFQFRVPPLKVALHGNFELPRGICLVKVAPRELLVPRGMLSPATLRLLKTPAFPMSIVSVNPGSEFPDPEALSYPDSYQVPSTSSLTAFCKTCCVSSHGSATQHATGHDARPMFRDATFNWFQFHMATCSWYSTAACCHYACAQPSTSRLLTSCCQTSRPGSTVDLRGECCTEAAVWAGGAA